MAMEVRGGGCLLVLGGALIAAGLGAAFAARRGRAHVNDKRRRSSTTRPNDEACKVEENLDKGIGCDGEGGQLDEAGGDAVRGLASLLAPDPIPSTPSIKLAEDCPGEFLIHSPVGTQENMAKPRIDKSPTFKNLENSANTEERVVETVDGGDDVVQEFSLCGLESGTVQKQTKEESELARLEESKEEEEEFSFSTVGFSKIQENNEQNLEEFRLHFVNAEEEINDGEEEEEGEETPSSEEVEEFSFRTVELETIHDQIKQTLEESKLVHSGEEAGGLEEEESEDDVEAPSSESESESQEEETEPSVEEESEREEEGSDNTGASSPESSAEAVWPAEVIEQENGSLLLQKHQNITEESHEEKVTTVNKAGNETEKYDQKVAEKETAAEESVGRKMGTGPKMKGDSKIGFMPASYSNRFFLHLLALALVLSLIFFAHCYKLYHLYEFFFPSDNVM